MLKINTEKTRLESIEKFINEYEIFEKALVKRRWTDAHQIIALYQVYIISEKL